MAVITWGKPKIEFVKLESGKMPNTPVWVSLPEIKEGTATLATEKGTKQEAIEEGGATVDVRYNANKYSFACDLFVKRGDEKAIKDENGVVKERYAVRLTPEDPTLDGWIMEHAAVSVEESWTSADGTLWKYTFDALKPLDNKMLKLYTTA